MVTTIVTELYILSLLISGGAFFVWDVTDARIIQHSFFELQEGKFQYHIEICMGFRRHYYNEIEKVNDAIDARVMLLRIHLWLIIFLYQNKNTGFPLDYPSSTNGKPPDYNQCLLNSIKNAATGCIKKENL